MTIEQIKRRDGTRITTIEQVDESLKKQVKRHEILKRIIQLIADARKSDPVDHMAFTKDISQILQEIEKSDMEGAMWIYEQID